MATVMSFCVFMSLNRWGDRLGGGLAEVLVLSGGRQFLVGAVEQEFGGVRPVEHAPVGQGHVAGGADHRLQRDGVERHHAVGRSAERSRLPELLGHGRDAREVRRGRKIMDALTEVQSAVQRAVTVLVDVIQRGVGGELGIRVELPHRDLAIVRAEGTGRTDQAAGAADLGIRLGQQHVVAGAVRTEEVRQHVEHAAQVFGHLRQGGHLRLAVLQRVVHHAEFGVGKILDRPGLRLHGLVDRGKLLRRGDDRLHVELPIATGETGTGQCGDDLAQLGQRGLREVIDGTDGGARRLHVTADHGHLLRQRPQTAADILLGGGRLLLDVAHVGQRLDHVVGGTVLDDLGRVNDIVEVRFGAHRRLVQFESAEAGRRGAHDQQQQHDEQRVANAMGFPGDRACV